MILKCVNIILVFILKIMGTSVLNTNAFDSMVDIICEAYQPEGRLNA